MPLGLAIGLSAAVALLAWRLRALTGAGAGAASLVGAVLLWPTGWPGAAVLGMYFVSSTVVSRLAASTHPLRDTVREIRDPLQVVANGGMAAAVAPLEFVTTGLGLWLATVTLAAAAADTWATGMGSLSRRPPRDILRGVVVPPGTSGGVTWTGTAGGLVGATLVSLAGAVTWRSAPNALYPVAAGVGLIGMLLDSVLGASVQARFHCPACGRETESRRHGCGAPTSHRKGWAWLDNDGVNGAATAAAAGLGWLAWHWLA